MNLSESGTNGTGMTSTGMTGAIGSLKLPAAKVGWVKVTELVVDQRYQRGLHKAHVRKIASAFDVDLLGVITCNRRNSEVAVCDGQHRIEAMRMIGYGDQKIQARIFEGLSLAEEAALFRELNRNTRAPTPAEVFKAGLVAGDSACQEIVRILRDHGLHLSLDRGTKQVAPGRLTCVALIEKVYRRSPEMLPVVAAVLHTAWDGEPESLQAPIIEGLYAFLIRYSGMYTVKRLVEALHETPISRLLSRGRELSSAQDVAFGQGIGAAMQIAYSKGLRTGSLPQWEFRLAGPPAGAVALSHVAPRALGRPGTVAGAVRAIIMLATGPVTMAEIHTRISQQWAPRPVGTEAVRLALDQLTEEGKLTKLGGGTRRVSYAPNAIGGGR